MAEGLSVRVVRWLGEDLAGHSTGIRGAIEQGVRVSRENKGVGLRRVLKTAGAVVGGEVTDLMLPATYKNSVYNSGVKRVALALPALVLDAANIAGTVVMAIPTGPFAPLAAVPLKVEVNVLENLLLDTIGQAPIKK